MKPSIRSMVGRALRASCRMAASPVVGWWPPYSRLLLVSDAPNWSIDRDMQEVGAIARRLGIRVADPRLMACTGHQSVFFGSHFNLLSGDRIKISHRVATAYFHGRPGSGVPAFDDAYRRFREVHHKIDRIQVSHSEMRDLLLNAGVSPERLFLIPIGVALDRFEARTESSRAQARARLGIGASAVVVGSFQKDGVGWGQGLEPKLEKGPDVLLRSLEILKPRIPELFVLLTGPARGFVKAGLDRLGIPYHHAFVDDYRRIANFYHALDVYLVTSRQEGGPKAVLETMACGVPLVTTRVGQAMDLVVHGQNGWMVEPNDAEGLAHWAEYAAGQSSGIQPVLRAGRAAAEANSYDAQLPLWHLFMTGFVSWPASAKPSGAAVRMRAS
jgi:glycosyltransferase involved in cell wall biosynthesis